MTPLSDPHKTAARQQAKLRRDGLDRANCGERLAQWATWLHDLDPQSIVAGYMPFGSEMDVVPLLLALRHLGHDLALPVITGRNLPLEFRLWWHDQPLQPGPWGILQPGGDAPAVRPDVVLAPLLAFDRLGWRLGYGGGFYDRTLTALGHPLAVGVAFAAQEVDHVPHTDYDHPLNYVITETELIAI